LSSIDLEYVDPRPAERREADNLLKEEEERLKERKEREWQQKVDAVKAMGLAEPERPEEMAVRSVRPDWEQSPLEVGLFLSLYFSIV